MLIHSKFIIFLSASYPSFNMCSMGILDTLSTHRILLYLENSWFLIIFLLRLLLIRNRKSKIKNDNNNNSLGRRYSKLYYDILFICLLLPFVCLFFMAGGVCSCGCLGFYLLYYCCCCFLCFVGCISFLRVGAEHHIMK